MKIRCALTLFVLAVVATLRAADITLENEAFRLVLAHNGEAKSLVVKKTDTECLMPGVRVPFVTIVQSRPYDNEYKLILPAKPWRIPSTGIVQRGNCLEVRFKDEFFVLKLRVRKAADYMLFTPEGVGYEIEAFGDKRPTEIDALEFLRLPVRERAHFGKCANVAWDEPAAVAVMAEEPSVEVDARRSEGTEGWRVFQAGTITPLGLWEKGAALMATPAKGFLTAVDSFERDCSLPRGAAMRRDPLAAASYWMMGAVNPANVDEHIRLMKKGGFRIGMVSYSAFASTCGHFAWRKTYPNGLADLRAVADKMRAAGIVPGLHFHYNKVSTDDAYVSGGVPDPRLATVQHVVLARDASPTDTTLCVEGNLAALRRERGRRLVLFGQELVSFEGVSSNLLVGVRRGVYGSRPAAHPRHAYGRHLDVDDWPRFIRIDQDTDLQDEIAGRLAELINGAGFRLFYFDGAEDTPQPFWHYVPFAQRRVWEKVKTPVIAAETAQKSHWGWHMFARGNAFDVFAPEYTRAAMEKYVLRCARDAADDFSTVNFGWIGVRAPGDRIRVADFLARSGKVQTTAGTQVDQIEYIACKALAWNAPLSVMGNLDVFKRHPRADELLAALKRWEDAKLAGTIAPEVREAMKDPKREWSLRPAKDGGVELVETTRACWFGVPLRLAVYVGDGARSGGVFRWLELTACARGTETVPVDAPAIRAGALDGVDVLVVPGGKSVLMAKSLGADGRSKVKSFVERGGGYVGTCAGCCLMMEPTKDHPDMLNMIPFTFGPQGGKDVADLLLDFNDRAEALTGIKKGKKRVKFSRGPVLIPSKPVSNAVVEVVATYASDVNSTGEGPLPSKAGQVVAVAGTYGRGRLFVLGVHPENDAADHDILRGAFKYVTGRAVEWDVPQRRRGQLAVGVVTDDSFGVGSAKFIQRLVRAGEFELVPLSSLIVSSGTLRHLDAVLIPDCMMGDKPRTGLFGDNLERTREFVDRGGRIIAWGRAAEPARRIEPRIELVADGDSALAALRAFAAEPVPAPPPLPGKTAKPLRAAIYADKGGSNVAVAEMLSLAPEYDLKVLSAEDYRKGALDGVDLLVQPGGGCHSQYTNLGPDGVAALKRYVMGGGRYYGICAGAFLASQPVPTTKRGPSRVGLIPFKDDTPQHYRGWAPIKVSFTDEGREALGLSITNSTVMYWGGPALVASEAVPDSDVKVWGKYAGQLINTCSSKPVKEMAGKAAFVGGRVGKGRVFLTCPHPEKSEANFGIVRGGIKYLTGVAPTPVNHDRVRGAVSVYFRAAKEKSAAEFYLGTLLRDRRFDATAGSGLEADQLRHLDAVVIPALREKNDEDIPLLKKFAAKGGRVVIVADTEKERELSGAIPGAVEVGTYGEVLDAILRN